MNTYTPRQLHDAFAATGITTFQLRRCPTCHFSVGYELYKMGIPREPVGSSDDEFTHHIMYNGACDCPPSNQQLERRTWADFTNWFNINATPELIKKWKLNL